MSCSAVIPRQRHSPARRGSGHATSLVRATLWRNGLRGVERGRLVAVELDSPSRIVTASRSIVWCRRYDGLAGLFRKDRGPSKELGRALCDEVKRRFDCDGFLTTDELPRYGISRESRRVIVAAAEARIGDCVAVYAYPEGLARDVDEYLHARLCSML